MFLLADFSKSDSYIFTLNHIKIMTDCWCNYETFMTSSKLRAVKAHLLNAVGWKVKQHIIKSVFSFFLDDNVEVLEAMITNMVHVIDALARYGVLKFGQGGQFSADLSAALLHCEATVATTRNWRLQADCLEKFSCLANCISPITIQTRFIPLLFDRMNNTRTLPCKIAAARTLLVILR